MKQRTLVTLFICALFSLLPTPNTHADTPVFGNIISNTTWTIGGSPYIVSGGVQVYPNITLTIDPGVEVRFNKDAGLKIGGTLIAQGTQADPILFTA
ncbi:MAG: hypothetical protein N3B18_06385, partial [Desulfobacterota bacterium]|nr:hypothetical protein [Thermodesulfobacteriota bacterium]